MTWNGSNLLTRFSQKYGLTDDTSKARVLEWMNEIQEDTCGEFTYPFLKVKLVKTIAVGAQEIDLSPDVPGATIATLVAGGALTADVVHQFKVTYLLFDEGLKEKDSIESEASDPTTSVTPTGANLQVDLSAIPVFPTAGKTAYRRIYMSENGGAYYQVATIEDNTTTILSVTATATSTIEPPEYSRVDVLADEDPLVESLDVKMTLEDIDTIKGYDPSGSTSGTTYHYARIARDRILIYPKPSAEIVLTYYVYKIPAYIFDDANRTIQMSPKLKKVLDSGVLWKGHEYKDSDGQERKFANYEQMKVRSVESFSDTGGKFSTVREVC